MEGRLLLKDCAFLSRNGAIQTELAILIEGGRVTKVAPSGELPTLPGDWEVACRGRLVTPGLIDCHAHLVGRQLRPVGTARSQERRWQPLLEEQLSADEVEALTAFALARALRWGVTLSVEHLRCPRDVGAALGAQAKAAVRLGSRMVLGHASSSREGTASGLRQLEDNVKFVKEFEGHPLVRPTLGFASIDSCDDSFLRGLIRAREELGVRIHGDFDGHPSGGDAAGQSARAGESAARMQKLGVLDGEAAVAIDSWEALLAVTKLQAPQLLRVLVPPAGPYSHPPAGIWDALSKEQVGIGSREGSLQDAWRWASAELEAAAGAGPLGWEHQLDRLGIRNPAQLCADLFGAQSDGVRDGALADLVVWDQVPGQENPSGILAYLLDRVDGGPAAWTIVNGRVVVREGQLLAHEYVRLAKEAATALSALSKRADIPLR